MSKVSVIILANNQTEIVSQAIESSLNCGLQNPEIIVVNNGPTPGTDELWGAYSKQVISIQRQTHSPYAAWLMGVHRSCGDFLILLNADDLLSTSKFESQLRRLERDSYLGLLYFHEDVEERFSTHIINDVDPNRHECLDSAAVSLEFFLSGCPMLRRTAIESAKLLSLPDDSNTHWDPWRQMMLTGYEADACEKSLLSKEHLLIFLRNIHTGDKNVALRHLTEVFRLFPEISTKPEIFSQAIFEYLHNVDLTDPISFVHTVFESLPIIASSFVDLRASILAELYVSKAFQNYTFGDMRLVRRDVVTALRYKPSFLSNKGVVSIFGKSFLPMNHHVKDETSTLHLVIEEIKASLNKPLTRIEKSGGGSNQNTYKIRIDDRPFLLRLVKNRSDMLSVRQFVSIIEQLQSRDVPVPTIYAYQCSASSSETGAWTIEEWLPGMPFVPKNLRWRDAITVAGELGRYLRHLHGIETKGFGNILSEGFETTHQTLEQWLTFKYLKRCQSVATFPNDAFNVIETACQFLYQAYDGFPKLCHGDFTPWNLLIHQGHVRALIDWDGIYGCDPALDLAILHYWIDDTQILNALLQAYAPDDPALFRDRIMAFVKCYAAYLFTNDYSDQPVTQQLVQSKFFGCVWT